MVAAEPDEQTSEHGRDESRPADAGAADAGEADAGASEAGRGDALPDDTGPDDAGPDDAGPGADADAATAAIEPESSDQRIRRRVGRIRWLTLLSSTLSMLLAMAATVPTTDRVLWTLLVVTSVQFAFVVPASLVLAEPKRWARSVLLIATPVSAVIWIVALTQTEWMLLPGNLLLAIAFVPLRDAEIADFFRRRDRSLADIRAGR